MNKPDYLTENDWLLLNQKYQNIKKVLKKLDKNYPVQYLIGNVDFYGYKIKVNKHVLIPRFETETLLEKTIEYMNMEGLDNAKVLEIGTGSGCISIVLKRELPNLNVTALDISRKALKIAKENSDLNHANIKFIKKDIFKYKPKENYQVIISNPPYIAFDETIDLKTKYEPQNALYAAHSGYLFYEFILANTKQWLIKPYLLAFEIGETQGEYLKKLAEMHFKEDLISIEKDLTGRDRYLFIKSE